MPIDIDLFRNLSQKEQENWKNKLETALESIQKDLSLVEVKLKAAMMDDSTSHSDLQPLLSYRNELKQVSDQIRCDLDVVNRFLNKGQASRRFNRNPIRILGGAVNIRANDTQNSAVPGAKTYDQILEERKKEEEGKRISELDERLKKLEEYRKVEQSRKQTQSQKTQNA